MGPSSKIRNNRFRTAIFLAVLLVLSACRHTERSLSGAYKLTFTSGDVVRVWRPDRPTDHSLSVMLAGNVKQYAVRDPYITGYADTQYLDLSAEPDARTGYFLIDTKSDKILAYGMDEKQWRKQLDRISWTNPELKKPHVWF